MLRIDPQELIQHWLLKRINYQPTKNFVCLANASADGTRIMGVVGFDHWSEASVDMHVAGDGAWVTRRFIYQTFDYAFNHGGVNVVIGRVGTDNLEAIRFNEHVGFEIVGCVPKGVPGGDMLIMALERANCKWLRMKVPEMKDGPIQRRA